MSPPEAFRPTISAALSGDEAAWTLLVEGCQGALLRHAESRLPEHLRGRVSTQDMVQEALITAHEKLAHFTGTQIVEWEGWTIAILNSVISRRTRDEQRAKRDARRDGTLDLEPAGVAATPSQQAVQGEEQRRLLAAINTLDETDRVIVEQRMSGTKPAEVAAAVGLSPDAERMRYVRALSKLQERLHNKGHEV